MPQQPPLLVVLLVALSACGDADPPTRGRPPSDDAATPATDDTAPPDDTGTDPDPGADTGAPADDTGDAAVSLPAGAIVLDAARVVDAAGVRPDVAVVIVGDLVWDVLPAGGPWPEGADVRDLGGASVIPGLIDAHVHLFHSGALWWVGPSLADNLAAQLAWGVVGVADLGSPDAILTVRDRVATGSLRGPRIWATGPMLTAIGSHPCEVLNDRELCVFVDGDGAAAVADRAGADGVKAVLADAAFTPWATPRLDLADLDDIVAEADAAGQPVVAHVDAMLDAQDAEAAGATLLAHPVFGDRVLDAADLPRLPVTSTLGAMRGPAAARDGTLLADDLAWTDPDVRDTWQDFATHPDLLPRGWSDESAQWAADAGENLALAHRAGRPIVAGSDAGYWFVPHGLGLHRELEALVGLGLTPLEALTAATATPADLLGWDDMGWVAAGYRADLVVLDGHPEEDISATRRILQVWLDGAPDDASADVWRAADTGVCVDDRDCGGATVCDTIDQVCRADCAPVWDTAGACGPDSACFPVDGLSATDGVCHPLEGCDLLAQDCAPAAYGEACVPVDRDTNRCWPAGPRQPFEACDATVAALRCAQGSFCSRVDSVCTALCDPDGPDTCAVGTCVTVYESGAPWFGACL